MKQVKEKYDFSVINEESINQKGRRHKLRLPRIESSASAILNDSTNSNHSKNSNLKSEGFLKKNPKVNQTLTNSINLTAKANIAIDPTLP